MVETFANRLKIAMSQKNMKLTKLANITGISKPLISNYLSGNYEAKQQNIYKLAVALNVNPAWLMGYNVDMNDKTIVVDEDIGDFKKGQILYDVKEIAQYSNLLEKKVEKLGKKIEEAKIFAKEILPKLEDRLDQALSSNEITIEQYNFEIKRFLEIIKILDGMTQKEFDDLISKYSK